MVLNTYEPSPAKDERTLVVQGKLYHAATLNRCTTCTAEERFLHVKQHHGSGDVTLECPWCETISTTTPGLVRYSKK